MGAERRALEAVHEICDGRATAPCRFRRLGPEAEDLLAHVHPDSEDVHGWALVTARRAPDERQQAERRERALTAAQRFMLSLSCDGVDNAWVEDGLPGAEAFRAAGLDVRAEVPVGLIWWRHA